MEVNLGDRYSSRRRIAIVLTLGLLTGLGPFTIDLYLPAFPSLKADLGINDPQVQLTLSATVIGFSVGQLLIGPLSDRLGRRVPLVGMTVIHVLSSVLVAIAPNVAFLTGMRALQGFAAAGGAVVAMAMARDLFSGRRLVIMLSRLALVSGLAPIIAPVVGSWLVVLLDWRGVFWVLAVYGAFVVTLVFVLILETRPPHERTRGGVGELRGAYARVLGDRTFVGVWLTSALAFSGLFSYVSSSSVLFQETFNLSEGGFGLIFALCSVGVFIGVQSGSRLANRFGPQWTLVMGTGVMVLAAAVLLGIGATAESPWALVPAMFAYTFGFGSSMPSCQVIALQHHRRDSGTAASLMGALNMGLAAIVGPVIGSFPMTSAVPMAAGMLICALLAVLALWTVVRPWRLQVQLD
ncbi:multidrug effflux MFS transporter [Tessaracoccus sp. OS52]|uniref:multidrug effflux MFS transporter n=1 Tax=Tessaracoccus sp. OS52 TaxID=2886691 RepID=UPI001D0F56F6|nr:multidrug effflux MFS transporter [Tessaracoccus sp. OS52]